MSHWFWGFVSIFSSSSFQSESSFILSSCQSESSSFKSSCCWVRYWPQKGNILSEDKSYILISERDKIQCDPCGLEVNKTADVGHEAPNMNYNSWVYSKLSTLAGFRDWPVSSPLSSTLTPFGVIYYELRLPLSPLSSPARPLPPSPSSECLS